jgi:NADPH:quinone reductase-like Zn-dependent oxidoreductase
MQLAVVRGARVIGTASERNHRYLRALGAEPTTYGEGLADRVRGLAPDGVDAAIDCVGTDEAVDVSLELVADRDRIASIAALRCATPLACSSPHSSRRESSRSVPARSSSTRLPKPIARGKLATSPASSCSFRTPFS